jgi:hypothetical protein
VKTNHLRALPGAKERLQLVRADLLEEGSFDAPIAGCHGVFHTATPVKYVEKDPKVKALSPIRQTFLAALMHSEQVNLIRRDWRR